jgi:5-methylcytosine-specific restriction endonuclease McrA
VSILHEPVLVMNRLWVPFSYMPVYVALTNVMRDMASVLDPETYYLMPFDEWVEAKQPTLNTEGQPVEPEGGQRWVRTTRTWVPAPDVIVLKKYGEIPPRKMTFNRPNLYKRDEHQCQYCGDVLPGSELTIEHIMPRSRGGPTTWENCVAACADCNKRKADKTPQEARMPLRKKPVRPNLKYQLATPPHGVMRSAWRPFLEKVAS